MVLYVQFHVVSYHTICIIIYNTISYHMIQYNHDMIKYLQYDLYKIMIQYNKILYHDILSYLWYDMVSYDTILYSWYCTILYDTVSYDMV